MPIGTHHMFKKNEFKFSAMRQFGSEQVSYTSTVYSSKKQLSGREIQSQVDQIGQLISRAFKAVVDREIDEKDVLIASSERRNAAVSRHDEALKREMEVAREAKETMKTAERESRRIEKHNR